MNKYWIKLGVTLLVIAGFAWALSPLVIDRQVVTETETEVAGGLLKLVTPLNAVTSTTTSSAIAIEGAKRVTLFLDQDFVGGSGYIATTTYTVTVSTDNTNYVSYSKLIDNAANTNAQGLTRVASKVADTGDDYIVSMDLEHDVFKSFKITATTVTPNPLASTTVTAKALIEY